MAARSLASEVSVECQHDRSASPLLPISAHASFAAMTSWGFTTCDPNPALARHLPSSYGVLGQVVPVSLLMVLHASSQGAPERSLLNLKSAVSLAQTSSDETPDSRQSLREQPEMGRLTPDPPFFHGSSVDTMDTFSTVMTRPSVASELGRPARLCFLPIGKVYDQYATLSNSPDGSELNEEGAHNRHNGPRSART